MSRPLLLAGLLLALSSCASPEPNASAERGGNSGSEGARGGSTVPCPCGGLGPAARVRVESRDGDWVTVRVLDALTPDLDDVVGETLDGHYADRLPCYRGVSGVQPGDEALAVFGGRASATEWASVRLGPWSEEIVLARSGGASLTVAREELGNLLSAADDLDACLERFGDWTHLPGWESAPNGTSDTYWCVEDGEVQPAPCDEDAEGEERQAADDAIDPALVEGVVTRLCEVEALCGRADGGVAESPPTRPARCAGCR